MAIISVPQSKKGLSIIEILVAMMFISVLLLALAYTHTVIMSANLKQAVRGQSEQISQNVITRLKNADYDSIEDTPTGLGTITRDNLRGVEPYCDPDNNANSLTGEMITIPFRGFDVTYEVMYKVLDTTLDSGGALLANAKTVLITVCWNYKGETLYTTTKTVIRNVSND